MFVQTDLRDDSIRQIRNLGKTFLGSQSLGQGVFFAINEIHYKLVMTIVWVIVALTIIIISIILYYISSTEFFSHYPTWKSVLNNLGGLLFSLGIISALWELIGKRLFAAE